MKLSLLLKIVLAVSLGQLLCAISAEAQCQNQICNDGTPCFRCDFFTNKYCSVGKGRCPQSCNSGNCYSPATLQTQLQPQGIPETSQPLSFQDAAAEQACIEQLKKNGAPPLNADTFTTGLTSSWQKNSPAVVDEITFARDEKIENNYVTRFVIRNLGSQPVSGYRLAWLIVFADPDRKPEVHYSQQVSLDTPIETNSVREIGAHLPPGEFLPEKMEVREDLAPRLPRTKENKLVTFFLADVTLKNGAVFHENVEALGKIEHDRVFAPVASASN